MHRCMARVVRAPVHRPVPGFGSKITSHDSFGERGEREWPLPGDDELKPKQMAAMQALDDAGDPSGSAPAET